MNWAEGRPREARRHAGLPLPKLAFLCLGLSGTAPCQQVDLKASVTLVRVPFAAVDASGQRIRDLRREELTLKDSGAPVEIKYLWTEVDRPLTVALAIDISSSEMGFVRANREAVRQFLRQVIGARDQSLLATVDEQPRLVVDRTSSRGEVEQALDRLAGQRHAGELFGELCQPPERSVRRAPRGCMGTTIWDGVFHLIRSHLVKGEERKAVLLLSDGLDLESSVHGLSTATEAAQAAGVTVYTIKHVNAAYLALSPITAVQAVKNRGMEEIAVQTGGLAFTNPKHLEAAYSEIEEDLRSQYVLAYSLSDTAEAGKWHPLELGTTRAGVKIRTQAGFRAP